MPVRGRTVTAIMIIIAAIYHLHGSSGSAEHNSRASLQVPSPVGAAGSASPAAAESSASSSEAVISVTDGTEDADDEEEEEEAADEAEAALGLLNSTQLRERMRRRRARSRLQPNLWRQNRRKITELTAITSIKDRQREGTTARPAAADDDAAVGAEATATSTTTPKSTLDWLAEKWSGGDPLDRRRDGGGDEAARGSAPAAFATPPVPRGDLNSPAARATRRRRWRAHGSEKLCRRLAAAHGVVPAVTWGSLPHNQRRVWQTLKCDDVVRGGTERSGAAAMAAAGAARAASAMPTTGGGGTWRAAEVGAAARASALGLSSSAAAVPGGGDDGGMPPEEECAEMAQAHGVVPGSSWGNLPEALKLRWSQLACDRMSAQLLRSRPLQRARQEEPPPQDDRAACKQMQRAHGVRVGVDWGTLPMAGRGEWTRKNCDAKV